MAARITELKEMMMEKVGSVIKEKIIKYKSKFVNSKSKLNWFLRKKNYIKINKINQIIQINSIFHLKDFFIYLLFFGEKKRSKKVLSSSVFRISHQAAFALVHWGPNLRINPQVFPSWT